MMQKRILQLVSLEPLFLWAGDVNSEETHLVFNMSDAVPASSTTIQEDPDEFVDTWPHGLPQELEGPCLTGTGSPCAPETEISVDDDYPIEAHLPH